MLQIPKRSVRFLPVGTTMTLGDNKYVLKYIDGECYQFVSGGEDLNPNSNSLALNAHELQELYNRGVNFEIEKDDYFSLMCVVQDIAEWKSERVSNYETIESIGSQALRLLKKLG